MTADTPRSPATLGALDGLLTALASGSVQIVDLTNRLSSTTPTLELPEPFANLIDFSLDTVSAYDEPGPFWRHANIHTGEHIGTHIDAPIHWISGRDSHDVADIPLPRLIGPAVVLTSPPRPPPIPTSAPGGTRAGLGGQQHGPLPAGGWVLYRTGWDQYAQDQETFLNADASGSHTPGSPPPAPSGSRTDIAGFGVETVGIDAGNAARLEPAFPVHYYLIGADKYGLTSLQNLAQLPPAGRPWWSWPRCRSSEAVAAPPACSPWYRVAPEAQATPKRLGVAYVLCGVLACWTYRFDPRDYGHGAHERAAHRDGIRSARPGARLRFGAWVICSCDRPRSGSPARPGANGEYWTG